MAKVSKETAIRNSFPYFLALTWNFLGLPKPTPIQYEVAEYLQHGPKRSIIEGFRGVGKSWITSSFVCWCLKLDPVNEKILVVSASKQRADDFSTFTQRLIYEMPELQVLIPGPGMRDSKVAFDVAGSKASHAPSVTSKGITSQLTGGRASRVIADDIEVPNNSATQDMREKLLKASSEFEAIIMPEIGRITYLGTPQTEESIYNSLRERGYSCRIWPARFPADLNKYRGDLAPSISARVESTPSLVGTTTEPARFSDVDLMEREAIYGKAGFSLQFMLDTSLSDADRYPLKLSDLIIMGLNTTKAPVSLSWGSGPELQIRDLPNVGFTGDRYHRALFVDDKWSEYEGSVMAIDPSGRGKDELGYAVVKQLHGKLYVLACGGLHGGYDDINLLKLATLARDHNVNYIVIEANFGDGMFTKVFSPVLAQYHKCSIEEVKHSKQKEMRIIDTLEPVINTHRLVIDESLVRADIEQAKNETAYSLLYQLTRITRDRGSLKHDDRLDALSIAVNYWVESMARDQNKAKSSYLERQLKADLKVFMKHVVNPMGKIINPVKAKKRTWN